MMLSTTIQATRSRFPLRPGLRFAVTTALALSAAFAVGFGGGSAAASPLYPYMIDNWDEPFSSPSVLSVSTPYGIVSQSTTPIAEADARYATVLRTVTLNNGLVGTSTAAIHDNSLSFDTSTTSSGTMTLEYTWTGTNVFLPYNLPVFFANTGNNPYHVDAFVQWASDGLWHFSSRSTIPGNEPVLECYNVVIGAANILEALSGLRIIYEPGVGSLCGVGGGPGDSHCVPEIDATSLAGAFPLLVGGLALLERRRRRTPDGDAASAGS